MTIKRIDHIAIVVPDIEQAQSFYEGALGMKVAHLERVDDQQVIVAFLPAGCALQERRIVFWQSSAILAL